MRFNACTENQLYYNIQIISQQSLCILNGKHISKFLLYDFVTFVIKKYTSLGGVFYILSYMLIIQYLEPS